MHARFLQGLRRRGLARNSRLGGRGAPSRLGQGHGTGTGLYMYVCDNVHDNIVMYAHEDHVLPRIAKRPINLMESLKNLKPTGFGLRMERIKPPLVVENPTK